jgi:DNA invertase Pin-like site-specific DNA recombinase
MSRVPAVRATLAADTVAYTRVSREEQARADKTSLADQHARILAKAAELGRTVGSVFEDAGQSGGSANRPALQGHARLLRG